MSVIDLAVRDRVAYLTLQRPEARNAIDEDVLAALSDALVSVAADPSPRALVVTGAGDTFCIGLDIGLLERAFADIPSRRERQDFVLAAYNGGSHHIRDAMELTRLHGGNAQRWADVAVYVLKLSEPAYYQHPSVRYGYMRGSETVGYVRSIRQRYQQYQGVKAKVLLNSSPQKSRNKKHRSKFHP